MGMAIVAAGSDDTSSAAGSWERPFRRHLTACMFGVRLIPTFNPLSLLQALARLPVGITTNTSEVQPRRGRGGCGGGKHWRMTGNAKREAEEHTFPSMYALLGETHKWGSNAGSPTTSNCYFA